MIACTLLVNLMSAPFGSTNADAPGNKIKWSTLNVTPGAENLVSEDWKESSERL